MIYVFHGIDCGRLGTAMHEFQELVEHLGTYRDRIWTAPLADVAEHLVAVRATRVG
jgi:hypothetical protein